MIGGRFLLLIGDKSANDPPAEHSSATDPPVSGAFYLAVKIWPAIGGCLSKFTHPLGDPWATIRKFAEKKPQAAEQRLMRDD